MAPSKGQFSLRGRLYIRWLHVLSGAASVVVENATDAWQHHGRPKHNKTRNTRNQPKLRCTSINHTPSSIRSYYPIASII